MSSTLEIILKKQNKIYHEGEIVSGVVVVKSPTEVRHDGLTLSLEGVVHLQPSSKNVGILDTFYSSVKPITLVSHSAELAGAGRIPAGRTELPFEVALRARAGAPPLLETYHGVFVGVAYCLRAALRRPFLAKPLHASMQLVLQHAKKPGGIKPTPLRCEVTPVSLAAGGRSRSMPQFRISVQLDSNVCALDRPFTGEVCVHECSVPIRSLELQLVRVETCGSAEGYARDATEIQNIQVGEGDVCRGLPVPVHMVFPRLFTCPTTHTTNFKIEFEVNLAVIFEDDHLVTENFPVVLVRA